MIRKIQTNKKEFLPLLLAGDEQESMIDRYLERGTLYILEEEIPISVAVVTDEGNGVCELKNLATDERFRKQGYARKLLSFLENDLAPSFHTIILGTGEVPSTLQFYQSLGFEVFNRIPNFFTEHYDHPIIEEGVLLKDMIYLCKKRSTSNLN